MFLSSQAFTQRREIGHNSIMICDFTGVMDYICTAFILCTQRPPQLIPHSLMPEAFKQDQEQHNASYPMCDLAMISCPHKHADSILALRSTSTPFYICSHIQAPFCSEIKPINLVMVLFHIQSCNTLSSHTSIFC